MAVLWQQIRTEYCLCVLHQTDYKAHVSGSILPTLDWFHSSKPHQTLYRTTMV